MQKLKPEQHVSIDGLLQDDAWAEAKNASHCLQQAHSELPVPPKAKKQASTNTTQVPWLENFMDLAGPRHGGARKLLCTQPGEAEQ